MGSFDITSRILWMLYPFTYPIKVVITPVRATTPTTRTVMVEEFLMVYYGKSLGYCNVEEIEFVVVAILYDVSAWDVIVVAGLLH